MFFINHQPRHNYSFNGHPRHFIGKTAVVTKRIERNRKGQVYISGTWYNSLCLQDITIESDTIVKVVGLENYTLLVEPV